MPTPAPPGIDLGQLERRLFARDRRAADPPGLQIGDTRSRIHALRHRLQRHAAQQALARMIWEFGFASSPLRETHNPRHRRGVGSRRAEDFPSVDRRFMGCLKNAFCKATMTTTPDQRFRELFMSHAADLRAFIGCLVRTRGGREDVLIEVARSLWEHFDTYEPSRPFGKWARGVAANKILQHQRLDAAFPARLSPEAALAVAEEWNEVEAREGVCGRREEIEAVGDCLKAVSERSARLVHQRYSEGRSVADMARACDSSPEAIQQSLGRVRQRLAGCLRDRQAVPGKSADAVPVPDSIR
jgi:RNA polymerase sigma-70 factor (ECF subfamily)